MSAPKCFYWHGSTIATHTYIPTNPTTYADWCTSLGVTALEDMYVGPTAVTPTILAQWESAHDWWVAKKLAARYPVLKYPEYSYAQAQLQLVGQIYVDMRDYGGVIQGAWDDPSHS